MKQPTCNTPNEVFFVITRILSTTHHHIFGLCYIWRKIDKPGFHVLEIITVFMHISHAFLFTAAHTEQGLVGKLLGLCLLNFPPATLSSAVMLLELVSVHDSLDQRTRKGLTSSSRQPAYNPWKGFKNAWKQQQQLNTHYFHSLCKYYGLSPISLNNIKYFLKCSGYFLRK